MFRSWVTHYMIRLAFTEFHLRHPQNLKFRKPEISTLAALLEIVPEWRDFWPAWELGSGGETGPEIGNLATWVASRAGVLRGAGCRGPRVLREIPGAEGAGWQNFRNSIFPKADPHEFEMGGSYRPN